MATPEERAEALRIARQWKAEHQRHDDQAPTGLRQAEKLAWAKRRLMPDSPHTAAIRDVYPDYLREQADFFAQFWQLNGISAAETREWLLGGFDPSDHELAFALKVEGVRPSMLPVEYEHPDSGHRMALLQILRPYNYIRSSPKAQKTLSKFLDAAGVERTRMEQKKPLRRKVG